MKTIKKELNKSEKLEQKYLNLRKEALKELNEIVSLVKFNKDMEFKFKKKDIFEDESGNTIVGINMDSVLFFDGLSRDVATYKFTEANIKDILHLIIIVE